MRVVYADQEAPMSWRHSIFLAGPTPRDAWVPSWRPEALKILTRLGYTGVVFIPENSDGGVRNSYLDQVEWERRGLEFADRIVFWVPRSLREMPGFTTNVEFGRYAISGKCLLGFPDYAQKMKYLEWLAGKENIPVYQDLEELLAAAIVGHESLPLRAGGERCVPVDVFTTPMFREWNNTLKAAGNRLDEAKVLWTFRSPHKRTVFSYVLWVKVWVVSEGRFKENEWIFSRTDVATVVLYRGDQVVLVREFRSPGRTADGFIHELPGGSCEGGDTARMSAAREVHEETGLVIEPHRLVPIASRQTLGILSTHTVTGFSVELTESEMAQAIRLAQDQTVHGEIEDSERTYLEVRTVEDLLSDSLCDWTTLGLVLSAVR